MCQPQKNWGGGRMGQLSPQSSAPVVASCGVSWSARSDIRCGIQAPGAGLGVGWKIGAGHSNSDPPPPHLPPSCATASTASRTSEGQGQLKG